MMGVEQRIVKVVELSGLEVKLMQRSWIIGQAMWSDGGNA